MAQAAGAGYAVGQNDRRPWGHWEVLATGTGHAVKRIVVNAGARLSLQRHAHRSEHWVAVSGSGRVTLGNETMDFTSGQHVAIGLGQIHRIENTGSDPLVIIEVQQGARLEEDDIERLSDDYGR